PAGEFSAVLPDGGVIPLGEPLYKFVAVGGLGGGAYLIVCRAAPAKTDIFHNCVIKQNDILEHHGVVSKKHLRVHRGNIHAAHGNAAGRISHSRAARRAQVLLPEPEGPTKAVTSPSFAVKLTSRSTCFLS